MKTLVLALILMCSTMLMSQTLKFESISHSGTYSNGIVSPTFDWSIGLDVPLTKELTITTSVYFYTANYKQYITYNTSFEKQQYFSLGLEYTFSSKPLLE